MYRSFASPLLFALSSFLLFALLPEIHGGVYDPRSNYNVDDSIFFLESRSHRSRYQQQEATTNSDFYTSTTLHGSKYSLKQIVVTRGGGLIPAGYNPFGYKITPLGEKYLEFPGSLDSDIGRFIASIKDRKTLSNIKSQWLEIVRVSKSTQSMRIYRTLQDILDFCLEAGFIN